METSLTNQSDRRRRNWRPQSWSSRGHQLPLRPANPNESEPRPTRLSLMRSKKKKKRKRERKPRETKN